MISIYSRISLTVCIVIGIISFIAYHNDMSIRIPYLSTWINTATLILLVLLLLRSNLRWQTMYKTRKILGFSLTSNGWTKSLIFEIVPIGFYSLIGILMTQYFDEGFYLVLILTAYILESILHLLFGKKHYKILVQEKAITAFTHTVIIIPWKDIQTITKRHNDLQFKLNNKSLLIVDLDLIQSDQRERFDSEVKTLAYKNNIFIEG